MLASAAPQSQPAPEPPSESVDSAEAAPAAPADEAGRTALNLLGEVNSEEGEGRRNENVRITLIDNNVLRELTTRMGTTATVPVDVQIENRYFASEFGQPPKRLKQASVPRVPGFNGELRWMHQNSVTSARSFFQAGGVLPAHDNEFGFTVGAKTWRGAALTVSGSQVRSRGNVNGNVLVPTPGERTPLTSDPATRALVQQLLDAYPDELPNRTDINPRALNTNDIQSINNDRGMIGSASRRAAATPCRCDTASPARRSTPSSW